MDPEELYRLIELQQENVVHVKNIEIEQHDPTIEMDQHDPTNIYQYLNNYQPLEIPIEVQCGMDEAPDIITLPNSKNIMTILIIFIIFIFFAFFLKRLINQTIKWNLGTDLMTLIKNIKELPYNILIWTHPKSLISRFNIIVEKVEFSTQRLYRCNNDLAIVRVDELYQNIQEMKRIFYDLLDKDNSFAKFVPRDPDEQLFCLDILSELRRLRDRLRGCEQILDTFISTRNYVIYELNKARVDENVCMLSTS